jgi:hypothetical protein
VFHIGFAEEFRITSKPQLKNRLKKRLRDRSDSLKEALATSLAVGRFYKREYSVPLFLGGA